MSGYRGKKYWVGVGAGVLAIGAALAWGLQMRWVYAYLISISLITFGFYGVDKRLAVRGGWRVPERVLHVLALAGGTFGGLLGQVCFRHKRRKRWFRFVFFLIGLVQAVLLAGYFWW